MILIGNVAYGEVGQKATTILSIKNHRSIENPNVNEDGSTDTSQNMKKTSSDFNNVLSPAAKQILSNLDNMFKKK